MVSTPYDEPRHANKLFWKLAGCGQIWVWYWLMIGMPFNVYALPIEGPYVACACIPMVVHDIISTLLFWTGMIWVWCRLIKGILSNVHAMPIEGSYVFLCLDLPTSYIPTPFLGNWHDVGMMLINDRNTSEYRFIAQIGQASIWVY